MASFREYTFLSDDQKTSIYVREWIPEGEIKGVVQIAHGISEYAARYDHFMKFLAANGYLAAANDHLGHGKSVSSEEGRLFFAEKNGWDIAVGDMKKLHDQLKERFPDKKAVLFGHSMGSFLARTYIIKHPNDIDAAVICGTGQQSRLIVSVGLRMADNACKKFGANKPNLKLSNMAFGGYNKKFTSPRTTVDWLSKNKENVDKYEADPLCGGVASAGLFRDMMGGIMFIGDKANIAKMRKDLPVFLISGSMDPVGDYGKGVKKVYDMFRASGMKAVSMKLYPDDRHEILNEDDKDQVYQDVLNWVNTNI